MSSDPKNYEVAYLLPSSMPEEGVLTWTGKLSTLIEENKGVIRKTETPKKRELAYPIQKNKNAYFGWTAFSIAPDFLVKLEKKIKSLGLLRHLIVEEEAAEPLPILRTLPSRPAPLRPRVTPREIPKAEEKLDLEALDKKLEEILGK